MANKTVVITGGNTGLGFECAKAIAQAHEGWHIVIACRDRQRGETAVSALKVETSNEHISTLPLNLASLQSVREFPQLLQQAGLPPLRALVCNAGIQVLAGLEYTQEGFELMFGTNHLGHFLLVNLLLEQLVEPARIVVVSSGTHDPNTPEGFLSKPVYSNGKTLAKPTGKEMNGFQRYATSKLCNLYFAYELDRRLKAKGKTGITVNGFDPAAVPGTSLTRHMKSWLLLKFWENSSFLKVFGFVYSTAEKSGQAMARLAVSPELEGVSGKYYQVLNEKPSSKASYNETVAKELWQTSLELTGLQSNL